MYELGPQEDEADPWLEEDWLVVEEAELELVVAVVVVEVDELPELDDDEFDTVVDEPDEDDDPLDEDEPVEDEDDPDEEVDEPVEVVVVLQGFCPG